MMKKSKTNKKPIKNELSSSIKSSMRTRILSAIVGLIIVVPAIIIGNWIFFGLITLFIAFACYEILGCARKRTAPLFIVFFLFVIFIAYWPIFKSLIDSRIDTRIDVYFNKITLPVLITVSGFFILFLFTVIYKDFTVRDACFLMAMMLLIGFGFQSLFYLRFAPTTVPFTTDVYDIWDFSFDATVKPSLLLIFVIISTFATDIGAYFVGVLFGKNKMNERISPKKTWEGFVGGIVVSSAISVALAFTLTYFGYPLGPGLTFDRWYVILILCLLLPVFSTLGDFVFSSIKRSFGIKDYGKLIPGHGGVLDRLDSILFSSIVSAIFIYVAVNAINGTYQLMSDLLI